MSDDPKDTRPADGAARFRERRLAVLAAMEIMDPAARERFIAEHKAMGHGDLVAPARPGELPDTQPDWTQWSKVFVDPKP